MPRITFKPKAVTKRLLAVLPQRAREVLVSRYGLGDSVQKMTLEAIGKKYGITRERVRQIENYGIATIKKSPVYTKEQPAFDELAKQIDAFGGIVAEDDFLEELNTDEMTMNHIHFLLVIGHAFMRKKEDTHFKHRWFIDEAHADKVHDALKNLYASLSDEELVPESKIIESFFEHLKDVSAEYRQEELARRWLGISKKIGRNPIGEWGVAHSPNITAKRMRDYAFLVIRRHGEPMHFSDVAKAITEVFNKKAHVATCHNELIKDKRFVLVGRGLYALSEWGHTSGVVKDVISSLIKKHGPLTREEIIDKVLKERYVKDNTIIVNLQNAKYFKKDSQGRYSAS
ncbi:MAG: sigma factor-like helix-turn-helix DNA-binding protein [Candidatus Paceibacterota bacterium]